jgi:exosortase A-associated hydrolase 1
VSGAGAQEIPLVFECAGEPLVGVLHRPENPADIGLVSIIAGGPQYRAGVGRGMVVMARALAAQGVPVLRFDYRGMGDSGGEFLGFENIADDLAAAVDTLKSEVPAVRQVVLWGGCDAASGAMIHGWKIPGVISLALGNPWVTTHEIHAAVMNKHYLGRLREWTFWRKVLRFEYNIWDYMIAGFRRLAGKVVAVARGVLRNNPGATEDHGGFVGRMLGGLERFEGPILYLISGQSVASKEFDELVIRDRRWQAAINRAGSRRVDFPEADQTFSDEQSRENLTRAIRDWIFDLREQAS